METALTAMEQYQVAEVELVYKTKVKASQRPVIRHSKDAYEILKQSWDENKIDLLEQFKVIFLNRSNKVFGIYKLSQEGITGTVADSRLIIAEALKANAVSLMLVHIIEASFLIHLRQTPCFAIKRLITENYPYFECEKPAL